MTRLLHNRIGKVVVILFVISWITLACGSSSTGGDEFIGSWLNVEDPSRILVITREGALYTVSEIRTPDINTDEHAVYPAEYKEGKLYIDFSIAEAVVSYNAETEVMTGFALGKKSTYTKLSDEELAALLATATPRPTVTPSISYDDLYGKWRQGDLVFDNLFLILEHNRFTGEDPKFKFIDAVGGTDRGNYALKTTADGTEIVFNSDPNSAFCAGQIGRYRIYLNAQERLSFMRLEEKCVERGGQITTRSFVRDSTEPNPAATLVAPLLTQSPVPESTPHPTSISTPPPTATSIPITPTPTATIAPELILFEDNFDDGNAEGWIPVIPTWNVVQNQYICVSNPYARTFNGEEQWTDYTVGAIVRPISGVVDVGIIGRALDADHFYLAQLYNGNARIYRYESGWTELSSVSFPTEHGIWYDVKFEFNGIKMSMYVDGVPVTSVEDAKYLNGKVGLSCAQGSQAMFDNVTVFLPPNGENIVTPTSQPKKPHSFFSVSLDLIANGSMTEGYELPPSGDIELGGIQFSLPSGQNSVTTQAESLPSFPTNVKLSTEVSTPTQVNLLITGGNVFSRFLGQTIGTIRLNFAQGEPISIPLVAGHNIREWKLLDDKTISTTSSNQVKEVWNTESSFGGTAIIDLLSIDLPETYQLDTLTSIEVIDDSVNTVGSRDPAINLLGVAIVGENMVKVSPETTSVASATDCSKESKGEFRDLWMKYQDKLGCPIQTEPLTYQSAEQPFENGHMFWVGEIDLVLITIGNEQGDWILYSDKWNEVDYSCPVQAPAGKFQPERGFGWIWCREQAIREQLGWGLNKEQGFPVGTDLIQGFDNGIIFRDSDGKTQGKAYILFGKDKGNFVRDQY